MLGEKRKPRRFFSDEICQEAVRLVLEQNRTYRHVADVYDVDHSVIRSWVHLYKSKGVYKVKDVRVKSTYGDDFKLSVVQDVNENHLSLESVCFKYGISDATVSKWLNQFKEYGRFIYNSRGRPKIDHMSPRTPKKKATDPNKDLLKELEYLRAENAYLKKLRALGEERKARDLKIGQKPSKH